MGNTIDLHPDTCNICGGKVIFTDNSVVYGRKYGSGKCYLCTQCGAYVGTHKPHPDAALGLLADKEMRQLKIACHDIFDQLWSNHSERNQAYKKLAEEMGIEFSECHFGYFTISQLNTAYQILQSWQEKGCK